MEPDRRRFAFRFLPARDVLVQALLLFALLVVVFPGIFLRNESTIPGDILLQCRPWLEYAPQGFETPQNRLMVDVVAAFSPYYWITKGSLEAGEWPLWNPYEYLGMPLMANMQSAEFYPPRLLHTFLGVITGQNLYVLLKLWLCGMTAYFCGKTLGLKTFTSRFLSVAWMMASYNLIWASWSLPDVAAWVPVVFMGLDFTLRGSYRRGFFTTALGGTLMLLAGHPETAFAMAVWMALYFVLRLAVELRWGKRLWAPVAVQSGAWTLVVLVFASSLLPFLEYLTHSYTYFFRQSGEPQFILAPGTLVTTWVPRFFGTFAEKNYWGPYTFNSHLYAMVYPGIAVWLGMTLLLTRGEWRSRHKVLLSCVAGAALFCILVAYNIPALAWVNRLPFFRSMLVSYHMAGPMFAMPLLAAFGVEHWLSRDRKLRELAWTLTAIVPAVSIAVFLFWFNHPLLVTNKTTTYISTQMIQAAVFAALGLTVLGVSVFWRRPAAICALLTAVFAVDMLVVTHGMNPTIDRKYVFPETKLTAYLQGLEKPARIGTGEGYIASGLMPVYGIEELLGYDGLYPARALSYISRINTEQWYNLVKVLSVDYVLHDGRFDPLFPLTKEPERYKYLGQYDGIQVYRDLAAAPRAYLVGETRITKDLKEFVKVAGDPKFDPRKVAYLEAPLAEPLPAPAGTSAGEARVVSHGYTRVDVDVDATQRAVLVLADAYFPGWRATVDGRPASIFPVDYLMRGIVVEPGKHRVVYSYFPTSLRVGLALSIAACLGSSAWVLVSLARRRNRKQGEEVEEETSPA
jgi:hypothetical protein